MRRKLTLLVVLLLSTIAISAQKKVAVWEVKALSENVTPMNKLQIQGAMEKAIANADGYEAYNRNAFESIMEEQNFQRGGNVSDDQIREIGKMAGVDYILLMQAAKEEEEIFVTANILDIETGKYGESDNELMKAKGQNIQVGCCKLASRLFNVSMDCGSIEPEKQPTEKNTVTKKAPTTQFPAKLNVDGLEMIFVEGGTFTMGCTEGKCKNNETPAHNVTLSNFYIGKYEVTVAQFRKFIESSNYQITPIKTTVLRNGRWKKRKDINWACNTAGDIHQSSEDDHPVMFVSWYDASAYCKWLSELTGKKFRLPTEAEWEYAARGGNRSKNYIYSGSNNLSDVGWYWSNSGQSTHPVGELLPNELGIYDMSGNIGEWCQDGYGKYSGSPQTNPTGSKSNTRVVRGGAWAHLFGFPDVLRRLYAIPTVRDILIGFRIVMEAE